MKFPNAVGRRNTSANERERVQKSINASPQKSAKGRKRAQKSAEERFCVRIANNQVWELPTKSSSASPRRRKTNNLTRMSAIFRADIHDLGTNKSSDSKESSEDFSILF